MNINTHTHPELKPREPFIHMTGVGRISLINPRPEDISLDFIVRTLPQIKRFNGDTIFPYTVADHSLFVSLLVQCLYPEATAQDLLAAVLHDAREAFYGDMISPVLEALQYLGSGAHDFEALCTKMDEAIFRSVGLSWPLPRKTVEMIAEADRIALIVEDRLFRDGTIGGKTPDINCAPIGISKEILLLRILDLLKQIAPKPLPRRSPRIWEFSDCRGMTAPLARKG